MSGPTQHIPFNYEGSKAVFGVKVAVFLLSGFSIPFVASYYQMYVQNIWLLASCRTYRCNFFSRKAAGGA